MPAAPGPALSDPQPCRTAQSVKPANNGRNHRLRLMEHTRLAESSTAVIHRAGWAEHDAVALCPFSVALSLGRAILPERQLTPARNRRRWRDRLRPIRWRLGLLHAF